MAVVTHGSFDEGPISLALPPVYQYAGAEETDPIFTAWDKSTGIEIEVSQVTDFDDGVEANATVIANSAKVSYPPADAAKLAAIDTTLLVPYTGATTNVDLGTYDISVGKVTIADSPSNDSDAATKEYVDDQIAAISVGMLWEAPVIDIVANAAALPGAPSNHDRYITFDDQHINEWVTDEWISISPVTNATVFVNSDTIAPDNETGIYTFNGLNWVYIGGATDHNSLAGLNSGDYKHLSSATNTALTTTGADAVPTGLSLSSSGIKLSSGGAQASYVVLTWNAISTSTFDHYTIRYKQHSFTYYTYLTSTVNTITIEGLLPNTSYDFGLASVNKYGTSSLFSTDLNLTTPADAVAPATVVSGSATGGIQYVILEWTHNTDSDLASYNIYRNTINDSATATLIGNCRTNYFVDGGRTGGQIYYYWLKAVDTSGNISSSFSTVVSATPRNVTSDDVVTIAGSKVLIDGSVYLSNWRKVGDLTMIDGGSIATNTVTLTKLNFTPLVSANGTSDIVATINATAEALQISGEHIEINGSTTFQPLGGNGRVFIFEDANTGLRITDDDANDVFKAEIDGTNVGDVTIGDWAGGHGLKYDKSANELIVTGEIHATSGTIDGVLNFGTSTVSDDARDSNVALVGNDLYENAYQGNGSNININRIGYNGGSSYYRDTIIGNGRNEAVLTVDGASSGVTVEGHITINANDGYLLLPRLTTTQRNALTKVSGMIVYDTTINQFCGVINNGGTLQWWSFTMNAHV